MGVVDKTYFYLGELRIPNVKNTDVSDSETTTSTTVVDLFIKKYERSLLLNALGVKLYNILKALLDDESNNALVEKWKDLVIGTDYEVDGRTYRWDGLRGEDKQSLVAFYIKSKYLKLDEINYSTTGMYVNETKNGKTASFVKEFMSVHSEFINKYQSKGVKYPQLLSYQSRPINNYDYVGYEYNGIKMVIERQTQSSLFQYLCDANELDASAFPDFEFKFYKDFNRFGL